MLSLGVTSSAIGTTARSRARTGRRTPVVYERPLRGPRLVWPRPAALAWLSGGPRLRVTGSAISGDNRHVSGDIGGHGDITADSIVVARPTDGRIVPLTSLGRVHDGASRSSSTKGRADRFASSMPACV